MNAAPPKDPSPHASPARRYDAVLCDVDGCLTPEHHDPFNADGLLKIRRHNELAYELGDRPVVTLCTGRPLGFAEAICRLIGNTTLPVICENGVWLWHPETNRFDRDPRIEDAHVAEVVACRAWVLSEFGSNGISVQPGKDASFSVHHADHERLAQIEDAIRARCTAEGWPIRVSSTWHWINCDLDFVSKGTAIDRLIEQTGLDAERLAGIGDTWGDRFIADRVSWFGCPSNAQKEIKARADFVSAGPEIFGVCEILEHLRGSTAGEG